MITKNIIKFFADNLDFKLINKHCGKSMKRIIINYLKLKANKNLRKSKILGLDFIDIIYPIQLFTICIIFIFIKDEILHIHIPDITYSLKYDPYQIRKEKLKKLIW